MQEVSGSIPLFSTKKALYFVGSMVLFFLPKPVFLGAALLRLHRFQAFAGGSDTTPNVWLYTIFKMDCLPPVFSAGCCIIPFNVRRKVEVYAIII